MTTSRRNHTDPMKTALRGAANAARAQETATAAGGVIAKRTSMAAEAMFSPSASTDAEMSRMVSEKTAAFSAAGAAIAKGSAAAAQSSTRYAMDEAAHAAGAMGKLSACRTPMDLFNLQTRLTLDLFSRGMTQSLSLGAQATRMGEKALGPVHRTVMANARRLKSR